MASPSKRPYREFFRHHPASRTGFCCGSHRQTNFLRERRAAHQYREIAQGRTQANTLEFERLGVPGQLRHRRPGAYLHERHQERRGEENFWVVPQKRGKTEKKTGVLGGFWDSKRTVPAAEVFWGGQA